MKYTALLEALSLQQIRYVDSKLGDKNTNLTILTVNYLKAILTDAIG